MKTSVLQMSVLVLVLAAAVVSTVNSTPIFDLRPSCIYRGRVSRITFLIYFVFSRSARFRRFSKCKAKKSKNLICYIARKRNWDYISDKLKNCASQLRFTQKLHISTLIDLNAAYLHLRLS
ncbi:hypothetical protein PoB_001818500 [Plakobranchus ocellatus]|uniref:Secreted protein n=1 Tax=Plakobranchus ocellatus TaxID=259542 RepID=A0AAV3Z937_9GAST|nr:hypothetical protein PoB_001818500 [Plakobranchus ocellatus]